MVLPVVKPYVVDTKMTVARATFGDDFADWLFRLHRDHVWILALFFILFCVGAVIGFLYLVQVIEGDIWVYAVFLPTVAPLLAYSFLMYNTELMWKREWVDSCEGTLVTCSRWRRSAETDACSPEHSFCGRG